MAQALGTDRPRRYIPSIEGIRGFGFLAVFLSHYFPREQFVNSSWPFFYLSLITTALAAFAVPAFFVLSGYLIGGILYDTRNREGYLKVFYSRRILRVFPVFYLTVLVIAFVDSLHHIPLDYHFWAQFIYVQNLLPGYADAPGPPNNQTLHLWSLAVEEQFYFLCPLIIWLFPTRRKLLTIFSALIVTSCLIRCATPLLHLSFNQIYYSTPTRVDAILLGVVLAIIRPDKIYQRIEPLAKYVVLAGFVFAVVRAVLRGNPWAFTYFGEAVMFPIVNIVCVATVIAVMEKDSWLFRVCSQRWACWLGSLSYSLYVFHFTYSAWFHDSVVPRLARYMPTNLAYFVAACIAFCLTLALSMLSYKFLEGPVMNWKSRLKYGAVKNSIASEESKAEVLAKVG